MEYNKETNTLTISYIFSEKLKDIPEDTQIIIFNHYAHFNKKVDNLPQNLTYLTFGYDFNQKVDNLPKNITHLTFGGNFDQKVDNFPKNITHLTFGWYFNQKVDNLPANLKYLKLSWYFQNKIILSSKLKEISLTCNNNLINNIPEYVEKIYIYFIDYEKERNKKVENLPFTLREIIIEDEEYKEYIKIPFGCILTIKN